MLCTQAWKIRDWWLIAIINGEEVGGKRYQSGCECFIEMARMTAFFPRMRQWKVDRNEQNRDLAYCEPLIAPGRVATAKSQTSCWPRFTNASEEEKEKKYTISPTSHQNENMGLKFRPTKRRVRSTTGPVSRSTHDQGLLARSLEMDFKIMK
jgi:hypothetical protein